MRFLLLCAFAWSCGDDSDSSEPAALSPPTFEVVGVRPAGKARVDLTSPDSGAVCASRGLDSKQTVVVLLRTRGGQIPGWTLRPLYGCGGARQCGFIGGTLTAAATPAIERVRTTSTVPNVPFPTRGLEPGPYRIRLQLLDETGAPAVDGEGRTYSEEILFELAERCPGEPSVDAGTVDAGSGLDAATDARTPDGDVSDGGSAPIDAADVSSDAVSDAPLDRDAREAGIADASANADAAPDAVLDASVDRNARDAPTGDARDVSDGTTDG